MRAQHPRLAREQAIVVLLFGIVFMLSVTTTTDPDLWWHLRTGETIVTEGIPTSDPFSFTVAGRDWITHEWGSQVAMWGLYQLGGLPLLMIGFAAITTAAFALVYSVSAGRPHVAGAVCVLGALATHIAVGSRPQMFNLLGVAIIVFTLERLRSGQLDPRRLWLLPVLIAVWANLHSGYLLGIAVVGTYAVGELAQRRLARDPAGSLGPGLTKRLFAVAGVSFLASALNPNGPKLWLYPIETLTSRAMRQYIQEWQSPDFHSPHFWPFAAMLVLGVVSLGLSRLRPTWTELLLLLGTAVAGLQSMRHIPIFAVVATPVIARHLHSAVGRWAEQRAEQRGERPQLAALTWAMAATGVTASVLWVVAALGVNDVAIAEQYPVDAVDHLEESGLAEGRGYNAYHWGGYLIWRGVPVYIDGRADVYGDEFLHEYNRTRSLEAGWSEPLDRYEVDYVLVPPSEALHTLLTESADWELDYEDDVASVFVRR